MRKNVKIILFWSIAAPVIVTLIRMIIDFSLGNRIELLSYLPVFVGIALAGLIFGGPLHYLAIKSKEG
ncbi:hypothetical protein [Oceanobacillus sp. CAU 1775]